MKQHVGTALILLVLITAGASACPYDFGPIPHYVKIEIHPEGNYSVNITPVDICKQNGFLEQLLGMEENCHYSGDAIFPVNDTTNVYPLIAVQKYNITITDQDTGKVSPFLFYPMDDYYIIWLKGIGNK